MLVHKSGGTARAAALTTCHTFMSVERSQTGKRCALQVCKQALHLGDLIGLLLNDGTSERDSLREPAAFDLDLGPSLTAPL